MEYIYDWMKNLSFYMIIVTVGMQLLPNSEYKKYIRFFTGLVLILLLCGPILKIMRLDDIDINYEQKVKEIERATTYLEEFSGKTE